MAKPRSLRQLKLPLGVTRLPAAAVRDLLQRAARQPRRNKFGAIRTVAEGRTFDSKAEATRYLELRRMEDAGVIRELECQPRFPLVVNGVKIAEYYGDFLYKDKSGATCLEDVKGVRTAVYKMKRRLFETLYGIRIIET